MTRRRRPGMAGSILEQFAELKSDWESVIGDRSREGQRLEAVCPTRPSAVNAGIPGIEQEEAE